MSTNLYWNPVKPNNKPALSTELKFALRKRFGTPVETYMDDADKPYLQGLYDAGIEQAKTLITAIEKYGKIQVFEE